MFNLIDRIRGTMPDWLFFILFMAVLLSIVGLIVSLCLRTLRAIFGIKASKQPSSLMSPVIQVAVGTGGIALFKFLFNRLPASYLNAIDNRMMMCLAFLAYAILYVVLSDRVPWIKGFGGVIKICAALASSYVQLGKFAADPKGPATFDRWSFIVGGLFVLASGFKDVYEAAGANVAARKTAKS